MRVETTRSVDLLAVVAVTVLAVIAALAMPEGSAFRVVVALLFLLVAPGYALVAALFPERHRRYTVEKGEDAARSEEVSEGLDGIERAALSLGLSIAVVPLLGLVLNYTPWGIRLVPILVAVAGFTLGASLVAELRRRRLPDAQRPRFALDVEPSSWWSGTPLDKALTVLLALSVVAAGAALVYVLSTPREGERFTEFYILGPGGMAEDYPTNLTAGAEGLVMVGVVNHEGGDVAYRWESWLVSGNVSANGTFEPGAETRLDARAVPLADEQKDESNYTFSAPLTPGRYKLEFRLFKGDEPDVYRRLHLYVDVRA